MTPIGKASNFKLEVIPLESKGDPKKIINFLKNFMNDIRGKELAHSKK